MPGLSFRERILAGIIASGLAIAMFAPSCDPKPKMPSGYVVQEDEVGWDCRTMGNKICGIDLERNQ